MCKADASYASGAFKNENMYFACGGTMDAAGTETEGLRNSETTAYKEHKSRRICPDIELKNKSHFRPNSKRLNYTSQ